jgi:hypothetical protein
MSDSTPSGLSARLTPSEVGARAEFAVATALVTAGKLVYLPIFGAHSRVDLVFEDDCGLYRVQCKTSRLVRTALMFRTCSNTGESPKDYRGEVDLFGVYAPELGQVYLVPVDHVPTRYGSLRIDPPRNAQVKGVRWARDYLLGVPDGSCREPQLPLLYLSGESG